MAGGVAYSSGIIFHLWERLRFHNVIWHCFAVAGASIHLWAVLDCMVLQRLCEPAPAPASGPPITVLWPLPHIASTASH